MQGRTVVITGASSGIGLATARAFAGRGANVVLVARGLARLEQAARQCEELGGQALAVSGDVTDPGRMRDVVAVAVSQFGGVDVWVNNAGTSLWGPFQDIPMDVQARLIQVDLLGAMHGAYAIVPHFLARGGHGTIINVVSIGGRIPLPFSAAYSAAKCGLAGFTDALRFELAAHSQIHVCGVYPAYVDTPTAVNSGNYTGRTLRPVPPVVPPERVAETIVGVALRPRRVRHVGALNALTLAQLIAPDTTGRLVGRLARWFLLTRGAPAEPNQGGLGHPHLNDVQVRGGWGEPQRRRARGTAAGALATTAAATAVYLGRRHQHARRAALRRRW